MKIDALFVIEREINGRSPAERLAVRQARMRPLVDELEIWLIAQHAKLSAKSELAKAITYSLKRWTALTRFVDDGRVCMTNNAAERALRGVAIGRANWTFAGSYWQRVKDRLLITKSMLGYQMGMLSETSDTRVRSVSKSGPQANNLPSIDSEGGLSLTLNGNSHSRLKRLFDISAASAVLVLLLPMIAITVLALLIAQGRPILIRHRRIGRHGNSFECLKFRSMVNDAGAVLEEYLSANPSALLEWEQTRKLKVDPRVTQLGRILRKSSIDELPQLINIVLGHMSVVGPRPIVAEETKFYGDKINYYFSVRPGLTGLWQVSGRSDLSYSFRVQLDAEYVHSRSFLGDFKIVAMTIPAVLRSQGSY